MRQRVGPAGSFLLALACAVSVPGCTTRTVQSRQVGTLQAAPDAVTFIWSSARAPERTRILSPAALLTGAPSGKYFESYDAEYRSLGTALQAQWQAEHASSAVVLPPGHSAQDLAAALRGVARESAVVEIHPEQVTSYCSQGCYAFKLRVNYLSPQSRSVVWTALLDLPPKTRHSDPFEPLAADFVVELQAQLREQRLLPGMDPTATTDAAGRGRAATAARSREHRKQIPTATGFAAADDAAAVPVRPEGRDRYVYYLSLPAPKAFVVSQGGGWRFYFADTDAMTKALDRCAQDSTGCWLYAVDDRIVWDPSPGKRVGRSDQLQDRR